MVDYDTFKRAAIRGQDEIVVCPYNCSHHINKSRIQYHLVKCRKQHVTSELETCPFNSTHRVPKPEFQFHITNCSDRRILETHKYLSLDETSNCESSSKMYLQPDLPPSEENWDNEDLTSTYEPEKYVSNKLVLRNLQGATKSERKKFRMEERKRVNQLSSEEPKDDFVPSGAVPLRPPKTLPQIKTLEVGSRLGMGRGQILCSPEERRTEVDSRVMGRGYRSGT